MSKVFVIGIDGAFPEFVFGDWLDELPNIKSLVESGAKSILNSTVPCLSATAWTSILTGKTPADTGIFEYIYRKNYSYDNFNIITSRNNCEKTIWEIASENNLRSVICNVLLTWPIKPFNGCMITGPLTPSNVEYIYPKGLKEELENEFDEIPPVDLPNFRDLSKEEIAVEVQKHTKKQIEIMKYLVKKKEWDLFFAMIPMSDRMNHTFWKYMDVKHRKYDPDSSLKSILKDFYKFLDKELGEFLSLLDDDTKVILLSDHGITRLHTRVNLTDWLIQKGYLVLKESVNEKTRFKFDMVDWSKTKAFAIGAYEGQVFLNLKGREPQGIVKEEERKDLLKEISEGIMQITGDDGSSLNTVIYDKKKHFRGKKEEHAPDLLIYFDDLEYGCNTTLVGNKTLWSPQTALGSDDAGHSKQGLFVIKNGESKGKDLGEISYLDVAPTVLSNLGVEIPEDMKGKVVG